MAFTVQLHTYLSLPQYVTIFVKYTLHGKSKVNAFCQSFSPSLYRGSTFMYTQDAFKTMYKFVNYLHTATCAYKHQVVQISS